MQASLRLFTDSEHSDSDHPDLCDQRRADRAQHRRGVSAAGGGAVRGLQPGQGLPCQLEARYSNLALTDRPRSHISTHRTRTHAQTRTLAPFNVRQWRRCILMLLLRSEMVPRSACDATGWRQSTGCWTPKDSFVTKRVRCGRRDVDHGQSRRLARVLQVVDQVSANRDCARTWCAGTRLRLACGIHTLNHSHSESDSDRELLVCSSLRQIV